MISWVSHLLSTLENYFLEEWECTPVPTSSSDELLSYSDATLAYKAEAVELQRQLGHLQSQYDMLTGQASALIQGKRARVASTSTVNGLLATLDDSLSARNLEVNFH